MAKKVPLTRFPDAVAVSYNRSIQKMIISLEKEILNAFDEYIAPEISTNRQDAQYFSVDGPFDFFKKAIKKLNKKAIEIFSESQMKEAARKFVVSLNQFNKNNVEKQAIVKGIKLTKSEPWLDKFMKTAIKKNVSYITNIRDEYTEKIGQIIEQGIKNGSTHKVIRKQLVEQIGMTKNRAEFVAVDQTGSLLGQMTAKRHQGMGIERFMWLTSKDQRVRDSHKELADKIFSYDNPPAVGLPGEDYRCRCVAIPVFEDDE